MSQKFKIALIIILAIVVSSAYFLYQIDKHEKALLDQEWLNPVPSAEWEQYLRQKEVFEQKAQKYIADNPNIVKIVDELRQTPIKYKTVPDILSESLELQDSLNYFASPMPRKFYVSTTHKPIFQQKYPNEYKILESILWDLKQHEYKTPAPSNPPKPVIRQSIASLYRYMAMVESVLILILIVSFFLGKKESTP